MSEVKAVQEEVVPETKQDTTESVSSEPASAPPVAASDKAVPKAPAKAAAKNTEQKTVLKKDAVKTKGQKAVKGKPAAPQQATPGIVNLNEVAHPDRKPPLKTKDYEETLGSCRSNSSNCRSGSSSRS
jgi:hypothetical protein